MVISLTIAESHLFRQAQNSRLPRQTADVRLKCSFTKSGTNFYRRNGSVVQVINFQASRGSTSQSRDFYINVGLAFDAICNRLGLPILEKPKECECQSRGFRSRLERLDRQAPECWVLGSDVGPDFDDQLSAVTERLANAIASIDSVSAFREHKWFKLRPIQEFHLQIHYECGELDTTFQKLQKLCERFKGREPLCDTRHWIEELRLPELKLIDASNGR
ncbi:DUF4304 domain-containing protein [Lignipirellula cremea]|uniref:DUF4304 domain-containing protein n=1 Tax=Lignipirellula cremea TaxID=2528010 RepID=UPI00119F5BB2|nr:DUF4304 domain-containing protein [Lignipirellula cremea]